MSAGGSIALRLFDRLLVCCAGDDHDCFFLRNGDDDDDDDNDNGDGGMLTCTRYRVGVFAHLLFYRAGDAMWE